MTTATGDRQIQSNKRGASRTERARAAEVRRLAVGAAIVLATGLGAWVISRIAGLRRRSRRGGTPDHKDWSYLSLIWDTWRATRGGPMAIATRQQTRLADLVAYARDHSPFYEEWYRGLPASVSDVRKLRPVTKKELTANFDAWVTDPAVTRAGVEAWVADLSKIGELYLGRYLVWTTSGTTGVPTLLLQDRLSLAVIDALRVTRMALAWFSPRVMWTILRRPGLMAVVYATGGHFGGVSFTEHERRLHPALADRVRDFPVQSRLPDLVKGLNAFRPALLTGYATALYLLAQEQEAGRLHIHPALVFSTAETLSRAMRERVETAFGCPVVEAYAASEAAAMAFECKQGRLHVNADWYIVEPMDAEYLPVPPDQPSHTVLVTNLANRVQPIIRYDLGDSVTISSEPCPCGSPLPVIRVEGRTDEILSFPTPTGETVELLPLALSTAVEETPGVYRYQIIQTARTALKVRLEAMPTADKEQVWLAARQRLHAFLTARGLPTVAVERAEEPPRATGRSGKFRHIWSEVMPIEARTRTNEAAPNV